MHDQVPRILVINTKAHIVPGLLGPAELAQLAEALRALGWEVSEEPHSIPAGVTGAAVTAGYLDQGRDLSSAGPWDLLIGLQEGAGYACRLADGSRTPRTVLLDPDLAVLASRAPDVLRDLPDIHWNAALAKSQAIEPYENELRAGRPSDAALYLMFGGSTVSAKTRGSIAVAMYSGRTFNPDYQSTPVVAAVADWFGPWTSSHGDVEIWLPVTLESVGPALERSGKVHLCRTPLPWLDEPEELARCLTETHHRP